MTNLTSWSCVLSNARNEAINAENKSAETLPTETISIIEKLENFKTNVSETKLKNPWRKFFETFRKKT